METYIPCSDVEESQASQLIQNVLGGESGSKPRLLKSAHRNNAEENIIVNDSAESTSTSTGLNTNVSSQYHLHGLAHTQSELGDQNGADEGTIKGGKGSVRQSTNNKSVLPLDLLPKGSRTQDRRQEQRKHSRSPTNEHSRFKSDKSKSSSSHRNSIKSRGAKNTRPHSPSEASDDSFAGDVVDPEQQFLASTKQFQVPLSELARSGHRAIVGDGQSSSKFVLTRIGRSHPDDIVLVPESDCSQSHDPHPVTRTFNSKDRQAQGDAMVIEEASNSQTSNSSGSISAPGSSLYEPRDRDLTADDLEATQPTAESDEADASNEPDPPWLLAAAKVPVVPSTTQEPTPMSSMKSNETKSSTSSNRGLLSLIHPKNKWRFQKYHEIVSEGQTSRSGDPENPTAFRQDNGFQETQPYPNDIAPLPLVCDFSKLGPNATSNHDANNDTMDVVPDSDLSREEPTSILRDTSVASSVNKMMRSQHISSRKYSPKHVVSEKQELLPLRTVDTDRSSDDDVPLAKISTKLRLKAKERDRSTKPPFSGVKPTCAADQTTEQNEVPSSVPEQDVRTMLRGSRRPVQGVYGTEVNQSHKKKNPPVLGRRTLERLDEEEVEESEEEAVNKRLESEELPDGDYQDVNIQASSRKRKRIVATSRTSPSRKKGPITRGSKSVVVNTRVTTRQTKRLRPTGSSAVKVANADATRVFALWRQDGHYYSGMIHMRQGDNRYVVKFDDGTEAVVSLEQMRLCELRIGDDVLLAGRTRTSKVLDVSKIGDDIVTVDTDGDPEEIEMRSLRLASRTIKSAWKDRSMIVEDIVPAVQPIKKGGSPTPSGASLASAQSNAGVRKKFLCKTGLVVSLSARNSNWEKEKESLLSVIRSNGGTVLDDWTSVIRMEGKHTTNNSRWVLYKDEVKWVAKDDIERVFLLAEDASQKPKFLMAVGLGIPCLSLNWLHDSIAAGEEKEWTAYMLPQGYSDRLSARISQQVDVDWGNSVHQLTDIMDSAVPAKPFQNYSILCVGADMLPQPKGKRLLGTDEKTQESSNAVSRIMICMGARRVEAVPELRYASARLTDYDYIVVKDSCANALDVKGLLSLPEDEANSQEA